MKTFAAALLSVLSLSVEVLAGPPEADLAHVQTTTEALFTPGLDLADVKLAIDRMVAPTVNRDAGLREINRLASDVAAMAADNAGSAQRLEALKRYLYEAGSWNGGRQFRYDLSDPLGENPASRKLVRYLETRRGNCVTMPILFLLVGDRLGLKLTLAEAPLHLFVKYTDDDGRSWNLEATSGAGFTRDAWYHQKLPMTDEAVRNGVYLRGLSREETVAAMAAFLVEHYLDTGAYEKAAAVADVLLQHYPNSAYVLAKKGTAYYRLLQREVTSKYTRMEDIPPDLRARADHWYRENIAAFDRAETLGWRIDDGQTQ